MLSMQDMFYTNAEPVWIVKPPSAEEKKKQAAEKTEEKKEEEYSILTAIPNYPYYFPPYNPPAPADPKEDGTKKETKLALWVSVCCSECCDLIRGALEKVAGVKAVECDILKEKVVVTCTSAAVHADVILAARREFKDARLWTDDD